MVFVFCQTTSTSRRGDDSSCSFLSQVHRALLTDVLLPLHEPNQMAVWSIQQPLIESYHEALVGCLVPFLELQPDLAEVVFKTIAAAWPRGFNSNTPKVDSRPLMVAVWSNIRPAIGALMYIHGCIERVA